MIKITVSILYIGCTLILPVPKLSTRMLLSGLFIRTAARTRRPQNAVGFLSIWSRYSRYDKAAILSCSDDDKSNCIFRYYNHNTVS